jgi:23S rRNA (uracil1939-C5)-methyltransferase
MKKSCLSNNSGSHTGLSENFDLEITDVTKKGLGLGRFNNRVVFCNNALPGDLVNVKVTGSKGSVITAEPIKFIKKSGQRADNVCLNKLACQACTLINLKYENQLFYKKKHFTDSLKRIGKIDSPENIPITLVPADQAHFNRNKAVFHFQKSDKIFQAGYYVPDSKKLVPIDNCILLTPSVNSALTSFINKLNDCTNNSLSDSGLDIIHKILVKYSNFTNQILFCLILKKNQACPKILKNILIDLVDNKIIHSAWVKETKKNKKTDFNIAGEKHLIESIWIFSG